MDTSEFRIGNFQMDDNFKKEGGQAIVLRGSHSSYGYNVVAHQFIHFREVAIKQWFVPSNNTKKEVELLRKVRELTIGINHIV